MNKYYHKYKQLPIQGKATIWYTVCNVLQRGISIITIPAYTRILSKEQYGSYSVFLAWLEIFEIIATFRLSWGGYVVGLTKYEDDRDRYSSSMQCLSITITSVFLLLYLSLAAYINNLTGMNTAMTLLIFALLYAMPAIQFWSARNRVEYRYISVLVMTVISSLLMPVLGVAAALMSTQKDLAVIAARVLVQGIIAFVLIYINCHKKFTFFDKKYWKRALAFNFPLLPYYLSTVLLHNSDRIIIKNLEGEALAAIYSVAYSAAMALQLIGSSINQALQPWMFKRLKDKNFEGIDKIVNISLLIVAGINIALIALAPEAIYILAPADYQEAVWIIPPLAASVVVMFFFQHFLNVEFYYEEGRIISIASIGSAALNIILNYILIPIYGYMAAGYTTLLSYIVFAAVHYVFMNIICKKNNCPDNLLDIKNMLLIMLGFSGTTLILTIGYRFIIVRFCVIFVILSFVFYKRKELLKIMNELIEN